MGEDLQTKQAGLAAKAKTSRKMTREDRLAEELRANLKRRKSGARREKDPSGQQASDESET